MSITGEHEFGGRHRPLDENASQSILAGKDWA